VKCCITEFELSGSMYVRVLCCQVLKELCSKCDEACVNSKNRVGRTALHIASLMGLVEAAEVLLQHKAKVFMILDIMPTTKSPTND